MNRRKKVVTVGIDFGYLNTCAAVIENGKPTTIETKEGKVFPCIVFLDPDGIENLFGVSAKFAGIPKNIIYDIKNFIGCEYGDKKIKKYHHEIVRLEDKIFFEILEENYTKIVSPEDVLVELLKFLRGEIEADLVRAVLTVPINFGKNQIKVVEMAAKKAGFEVLQVLHEPKAAAIYYSEKFGKMLHSTVLVVDLSEGFPKFSVLKIDDKIEVLCFSEVDFKVEDLLEKRFSPKILKNSDIPRQFFRELIFTDSGSRESYFEVCLCELMNFLDENRFLKEDFDYVLPVGGSRIFLDFKVLLKEFFEDTKIMEDECFDEILAKGAAMMAFTLNQKIAKPPRDEAFSIISRDSFNKYNISPLLPFTIGFEELYKSLSPIFEKGTSTPTAKKLKVSVKNRFKIFAGDWTYTKFNTLVKDVKLNENTIEVFAHLKIDENLILKLTLTESTKKRHKIQIDLKNVEIHPQEWTENQDKNFQQIILLKKACKNLCDNYMKTRKLNRQFIDQEMETNTTNLKKLKWQLIKFKNRGPRKTKKFYKFLDVIIFYCEIENLEAIEKLNEIIVNTNF